MSSAIALFSKTPIAGCVKTRLQPLLTPSQAADLQLAFVLDFWYRLRTIPDVSLHFYCDRPWTHQNGPVAPEKCNLQRGSDLGRRILNCFVEIQRCGYERVLVVGSDSPTLPLSYLEEGLERLRYTDAVLGASEDGGYYAVGCRKMQPHMFDGVRWSSTCTRADTCRAFSREELQFELIPNWYDVDTAGDLKRLAAELDLPSSKDFQHTDAWFDSHQPFNLPR